MYLLLNITRLQFGHIKGILSKSDSFEVKYNFITLCRIDFHLNFIFNKYLFNKYY